MRRDPHDDVFDPTNRMCMSSRVERVYVATTLYLYNDIRARDAGLSGADLVRQRTSLYSRTLRSPYMYLRSNPRNQSGQRRVPATKCDAIGSLRAIIQARMTTGRWIELD